MERFSIKDIVEGLQSIKERMDECGCSDNKEENAVDAALYFISNITNLQMALYSKNSLQLAVKVMASHSCFDDKAGTLIPVDKANCNGCMFKPSLEEGADGVDCPDKFRIWLMKKVIE